MWYTQSLTLSKAVLNVVHFFHLLLVSTSTTLKLLSLSSSTTNTNSMGTFQSFSWFTSQQYSMLLTILFSKHALSWFLEYLTPHLFFNSIGFTLQLFFRFHFFILFYFISYVINDFNKQFYKAYSDNTASASTLDFLSPILEVFALIFVSIFLNTTLFLDFSTLDFQPRKMSI